MITGQGAPDAAVEQAEHNRAAYRTPLLASTSNDLFFVWARHLFPPSDLNLDISVPADHEELGTTPGPKVGPRWKNQVS